MAAMTSRRGRLALAVAGLVLLLASYSVERAPTVHAVTTGNGSLVYSPAAGSSFDPAGTTYAKIITLKNNGPANGTLLVTYDQLVWVNGVQVYPIYKSTDNGSTWSLVSNVNPSNDFSTLTRTAEPSLFELPQAVGSLAAGTVLLAGMIMPADKSSTRIVIYKSTNQGTSWSLLSTVDTGGPAVYDPSPTSTTTAIWEPSLNLDNSGNLVCYFSDERQKANNILQAVSYHRSTDGGLTWGTEGNVAAIPNQSDRPGMITVTKLPNGQYMAAYEVVNRPSQTLNTAVVYTKFSSDGVTWTANDLGTAVQLSNGRGIGSSPYIKWFSAGGPNGMVIISSMWALDSGGNISGGENFYVNYNLGLGNWERFPFAVTYNPQSGNFSGFAQAFDTSVDGLTLYQATDVDNPATTYNDIRVGSMPLNVYRYEAARAVSNHVQIVNHVDASNGQKVGYINYADSYVKFVDVNVPAGGTYTVNVRYDNGTGSSSSQTVSVNGGGGFTLTYSPTVDWGRFLWAQFTTNLSAGNNTIQFTYSGTYAELDSISVYLPGVGAKGEFKIVNRNSAKDLEIPNASTSNGVQADQWGDTNNPTQIWSVAPVGAYYKLTNKNSGKVLEVLSSSQANGAVVDQWTDNGGTNQQWSFNPADSGYYKIPNRNSAKLLEIYQNSTANGALADQWGDTGYPCQQWTLVKEGIR